MTYAEMAIKIINIKIAILKIISKSNPIYITQYQLLKQRKEKEILKIGMMIQKSQDISEFVDVMLLKSIINSPEFDLDSKKHLLNICKDTFALLMNEEINDITKQNLKEIM